jgi:hypothetical protein
MLRVLGVTMRISRLALVVYPIGWLVSKSFGQLEKFVQPGVQRICWCAEKLYLIVTKRPVQKVG